MAAPIIRKKPNLLNFSLSPMYLVLESDKFTGAQAPYTPDYPNLAAYVEVWEYDSVNDTDIFIASAQAPYNPNTKQVTFDLRKFTVQLAPGLPDFTSSSGSTEAPLKLYYIKYADQYGTPATPETLSVYKNNDKYFTAIYGYSRQTIGDFDALGGIQLYSYKNIAGGFFAKPITTIQPEWLYFWIPGTGMIAASIYTTLYYEDGTTDVNVYTENLNLTGSKINWINSGYAKRVTPAAPSKTVIAYDVLVSVPVGLGTSIVAKQKYTIEIPGDEDKYLAYFNGLGGIDSVRIKGQVTETQAASVERFERTQWGGVNQNAGLIDAINPSALREYSFNTGYYDFNYIEQLKIMALAPAWLLDLTAETFYKLTPKGGQLKTQDSEQDAQLRNLELKYYDHRAEPFPNLLHT